jgi:hypothetical protein
MEHHERERIEEGDTIVSLYVNENKDANIKTTTNTNFNEEENNDDEIEVDSKDLLKIVQIITTNKKTKLLRHIYYYLVGKAAFQFCTTKEIFQISPETEVFLGYYLVDSIKREELSNE